MHDHNFPSSGVAPIQFSASVALLAKGTQLAATIGPDPTTVAALFAGVGTFLMGVVNTSREVRAWLDRRAARRLAFALAQAPALAPAPAVVAPAPTPLAAEDPRR